MLGKGLIIFIGFCITIANVVAQTNNTEAASNNTVPAVTNSAAPVNNSAAPVTNSAAAVTNSAAAVTNSAAVLTTCTYVTTCINNCTVATAAPVTVAASVTSAANATLAPVVVSNSTTVNCTATGVSGACCSCITACGSSLVTLGPNVTPAPAPPKTTGKAAPVNAFAGLDQRLPQVLLSMFPSIYSTPESAATAITSQAQFFNLVDSLKLNQWLGNCQAAMLFYQYMEDQIAFSNDNGTKVNYARLANVLGCKQDCNFNKILSKQSNFTEFCIPTTAVPCATDNFAKFVVKYLPPTAGAQCRAVFPSLASALNTSNPAALASTLSSNPSQILFLTPSQLKSVGTLSQTSALAIAQSLGSSSITLTPIMAKSLGSTLANNTNVTGIASIASGIPLSCFDVASGTDLLNSVSKMDTGNMDSFRKNYIASQIASKLNDSVSIKSFLTSTSDSTMTSAITTAQLNSLGLNTAANLVSIPAANLPKAFLKSFARSSLKSSTLDSVGSGSSNSTITYAQLLPGLQSYDLANITSDSTRMTTIESIVSASLSQYVNMTSTQRTFSLNSYLNSAKTRYNTTNITAIASYLSSASAATLYPLFIEANDTVLTAVSQFTTFGDMIAAIAKLSASQCCIFTRSGRKLFASYAVAYTFTYKNLALSDLYKLGPCLASVLPDAYFSMLDASTFVSYFSTLGSAFQPEASQVTQAQTFIKSYVTAYASANLTKDTIAFSTLSDLAIFYPWTESTYTTFTSNSSWTTSGGGLLSTIQAARTPTTSANQLCQIGLTNTATYTSLINTYASTFVTNYLFVLSNGTSSARRKRATTTFTCDTLNTMGSPAIGSLTVAQLSTISVTEFYSCLTLLGNAANSWSSSQLSQLVITAKAYYVSISANTIPDSDLAALNSILTGLIQTELAVLKFTTTTSISALGALTGWSTSQLTGLATPITTYISSYLSGTITSSFMTSAGNLLCSLSSTQIADIPVAQFTVSALSKISISCPNIAYFYSYAKTKVTAYSSLSSSTLSELGSVIAGISTTDIATISADDIGSITSSAWTNMPAATVNALSTAQLAGLSVDQVTSLLNNPNAGSFSSSITSSLKTSVGLSSNACIQSISMISLMLSSLLAIFFFNL